jgi:hypothetical protein
MNAHSDHQDNVSSFEDDGEVPDESIDMRYEFSNVAQLNMQEQAISMVPASGGYLSS